MTTGNYAWNRDAVVRLLAKRRRLDSVLAILRGPARQMQLAALAWALLACFLAEWVFLEHGVEGHPSGYALARSLVVGAVVTLTQTSQRMHPYTRATFWAVLVFAIVTAVLSDSHAGESFSTVASVIWAAWMLTLFVAIVSISPWATERLETRSVLERDLAECPAEKG